MGKYLDTLLQPYAQSVPSFIKSSFELKKKLEQLPPLPANARLFTSDAVSMYTMIDTDHAIPAINRFLRDKGGASNQQAASITKLLNIIMRNNIFKFGDTIWLQLTGTAMGTPPAPTYATIYYAVHEDTFIDRFKPNLAFYGRYIDDVIGIWIPDDDPDEDKRLWELFQNSMNGFGKLTWEFAERSKSVDYLDLTITISNTGKITTSLYEKALNLYLYLPPFSSHPPGVFKGMIHGMVTRIIRLNSNPGGHKTMIKKLYQRLRQRGFSPKFLTGIINHALTTANLEPKEKVSAVKTIEDKNKMPLLLHLPYNPLDPPSSGIQRLWERYVENFKDATPFRQLPLQDDEGSRPLRYSRLIICYHRPRNLAFYLTPRRIDRLPGISPREVLQKLQDPIGDQENPHEEGANAQAAPQDQAQPQGLINPYRRR